jgi:uncharacterized protein YjiK
MKKYANYHGYSDVRPYEVVKVISEKTIEVKSMKVEKDPTWSPDIKVGGFSGHCVNQDNQKWLVTSDPEGYVLRARLRKDGRFHSEMGKHLLSDEPIYYYDYNF